jgi:peptidoglycan/LPS O-acetylase OafA/YrhL
MRIGGLDFVRGMAILLVLLRHGMDKGILHQIGWIGVDLFFVLSGFLISSLVFKEYKRNGTFQSGRFLWRRAFKIYPAFFFYVLVGLLLNYYEHDLIYEPRLILNEVFFLQSYLPHIWSHTWSVAVEEHFYFALALIAAWRIPKWNPKSNRLLFGMIFLLLLTFSLRLKACLANTDSSSFAFTATHLRMDGILIGVMVAFLIHFRNAKEFLSNHKWHTTLACLSFIWPPFVFSGESFFMNTIGLSIMNLGFGLLILLVSEADFSFKLDGLRWLHWIKTAVCFIGINSYAIYLWHLLVQQELFRFQFSGILGTLIYLAASILIGVIFTFLIERPMLKWRESWSYSKQS